MVNGITPLKVNEKYDSLFMRSSLEGNRLPTENINVGSGLSMTI